MGIAAWNEVFPPGGQSQDEARAHHEQIRKQQERFLERQKQPGYVIPGFESWVVNGLPANHPVKAAVQRATINKLPYNLRDLFVRHSRGEAL